MILNLIDPRGWRFFLNDPLEKNRHFPSTAAKVCSLVLCSYYACLHFVLRLKPREDSEAGSEEVPLKALRFDVTLLKRLALVQLGCLFISVIDLTAALVDIFRKVGNQRLRHGLASFVAPQSAS